MLLVETWAFDYVCNYGFCLAYLKLDSTWNWCKQYLLLAGAKDRWAKIPVYQPADGRPAWRPSYRPDNRPTTTTPTTRGTTTTTTTHRPYHRHHHHHNHSPPQIPNGKPDTCDTSYDAVSVIRRELFVFKGQVRIQCCLESYILAKSKQQGKTNYFVLKASSLCYHNQFWVRPLPLYYFSVPIPLNYTNLLLFYFSSSKKLLTQGGHAENKKARYLFKYKIK